MYSELLIFLQNPAGAIKNSSEECFIGFKAHAYNVFSVF